MKHLLLILMFIPLALYGQHNVTATYYHAGPKHGLSWITAGGNRINVKKLNAGKLRWVALSHNLLKHYNYGDTIIVVSNNPKLRGKWVVMDKMHKRHYNKIDFLTPSGKNLGMLKPTKVKIKKSNGVVAELVDALDLGSSAARREGSSPSYPTTFIY